MLLVLPSSPVGNRSEPPPPVVCAVVVAGLEVDEVRSVSALVLVVPGPVARVDVVPEQVAPVRQQPVERQ